MKLCAQKEDIDILKICHENATNFDDLIQSPADWARDKEIFKNEYLQRLKEYEENRSRQTRNVYKVDKYPSNSSHFLFKDRKKSGKSLNKIFYKNNTKSQRKN